MAWKGLEGTYFKYFKYSNGFVNLSAGSSSMCMVWICWEKNISSILKYYNGFVNLSARISGISLVWSGLEENISCITSMSMAVLSFPHEFQVSQ